MISLISGNLRLVENDIYYKIKDYYEQSCKIN
jgi:hypothetical protein